MILLRIIFQPRVFVVLAVATLLALFSLCCFRAAEDCSAAYDEPIHMLAGYSYWSDDGPETLTANLRAAQLWVGLPLRSLDLKYPDAIRSQKGLVTDVDARVMRDFLHDQQNDPDTMLRLSRGATTVLGLGLGLVLFWWSRRLFGNAAGILTLGLYCFEPMVIAHSALATTDIAVTLMFTLSLAAWWQLLHRVSWGTVLFCGLATGVLATTKLSGVLLAPAVAVMLFVRVVVGSELVVCRPFAIPAHGSISRWRPLLFAAGGSLLIAYGVIWAVYGFHYARGPLLNDASWIDLLVPQATPTQHALNFLRLHHALPQAFLYDAYTFINNLSGRRAFLLGAYSVEGWTSYFPVTWLTKTSFPTILALAFGTAAGGLALLRRHRAAASQFYSFTPLAAFGIIYGVSALANPINIGLRHLLPLYPTLFVLAGYGVRLLPDTAVRARAAIVNGFLLWSAAVAWNASPAFLSYFNPAAGGTVNGHRIAVESNFDWGQDLPKIARWQKHRTELNGPDSDPPYLAYYGLGDPARYGIRARLLPGEPDLRPIAIYPLKPGTYVISATLLQALGGRWVWGPWRPSLERVYRSLGAELSPLYAPSPLDSVVSNPANLSALLQQKIGLYDELRFARLCAYLRQRTPTARITAAIFVYEIGAAELTAALLGPAPMTTDIEIKGLSRLPLRRIDFLR